MSDNFSDIWRKFQGTADNEPPQPCPIAAEFLTKIEEWLFASLTGDVTRQHIAQAKFLLQEEYQSWKKSLPPHHVRVAADRHQCLSAVYDRCYDRLHLMELSLRPAVRFPLEHDPIVPPTPPVVPQPPRPPQIAGIFLGELDE